MHLRFSTSRGTPVALEETGETLGTIEGIVLHPDKASVEAFTVRTGGRFSPRKYLLTIDIVRWGTKAWVRDAGALCHLEDLVRLQTLLEDPRRVLGQPIRTESGTVLGICKDVQFDTLHFLTEALFPRKGWTDGTAIPVAHVTEVRQDGIIVRDLAAPEPEPQAEAALPAALQQVLTPPEAA
jgi:uncharacterized protein YrrD